MNSLVQATYLSPAGTRQLTRQPLASSAGFDEAWLQRQLFEQPHLVPVAQMDAGSQAFVPIATEFALPSEQGRLRLDILGVTPAGKLVLVECKLWRNPEARREVIGQILDYASILAQWSFGDLEAQLKSMLGWRGENPLYRHVRERFGPLNEAEFVDGVQRSLAQGDFLLVIAGDGIRADAQRIAHQIERRGGLASRLALLEVGLWMDGAGGVLLMPALSARTEIIRHRIVVDSGGRPFPVASDLNEDIDTEDAPTNIHAGTGTGTGTGVPSPAAIKKHGNKCFWQRFIDTLEVEHPEQAPPRHAVNNAVRMPLPSPATALTLYRAETEKAMGAFVRMRGEPAREAFEALSEDASLRIQVRDALGVEPAFRADGPADQQECRIFVQHPLGVGDGVTESRQMAWLQRAANAMVNALRPRLERLSAERSQ